jgi:hypothetical protein
MTEVGWDEMPVTAASLIFSALALKWRNHSTWFGCSRCRPCNNRSWQSKE